MYVYMLDIHVTLCQGFKIFTIQNNNDNDGKWLVDGL